MNNITQNVKNDIITQIHAARGNRKALLALASSETCDQVAYERGVSPIYAATHVAQRLFDASEVTIRWKAHKNTPMRKRRYDLTDANQAYDALEMWGMRSDMLEIHEMHGSLDGLKLPEWVNPNNSTVALQLVRHGAKKGAQK